jgi:hypothetical protein
LREDYRLGLFQNMGLRKIFGPKSDKLTGEWRRLHNEKPYDLYTSPNIQVIKSRRVVWVEHGAYVGDRRGACRVLVGRLEGVRQLGRPRCRWEANIKMDVQKVGCGSMDWINLAQNRDRWWALVNVVMNFQLM